MNHVLLVEDNSLNRMVVEDLFEFDDIPATLHCAESGEEALEMTRQINPMLVLMDLELPGLSGLEAMRLLREDPETQNIAIWALSAHAMKGDAAQAIAAGFNNYVTKPIDTKVFAQQLREFVATIQPEEASSCRTPCH